MIRHLTILLLCFFLSSLSGQNIVVVDETNNELITGVAIFNLVKTKITTSDLNGTANINPFQSFERIYFQHISYLRKSVIKSNLKDTMFLAPKATDLNEVVISVSKFEQRKREVPQKIVSFQQENYELINPQTSADLLGSNGNIFIQKSQLGGGSPIIRGFSTNRVLITVDGVRLNNAIFRSGNIHNILSINPFNIENTEVILGSGSVIYGSDAIGGVMNFYTTTPRLSKSDEVELTTHNNFRYSTANKEHTAQFAMNLGLRKLAFHTSFSFSDFDNLKMGKSNENSYLTRSYVAHVNGQDMIIPNNNPRIQKFTHYSQFHASQKLLYKVNERVTLDLGLHHAATSNIPRFDRLTIMESDNTPKYAEWDYGPQKWFLANTQFTKVSSRSQFFDKLKASLAYQNTKESRISRRFGNEFRLLRSESVDAISVNIDLEKSVLHNTNFSYGMEYIHNYVRSNGISENILNNQVELIASRYPNNSKWTTLASYLSFKYRPNSRLSFQTGIRYNKISIEADLTPNAQYYPLPYLNANLDTSALTGTAGVSWEQSKTFLWKLNVTSAFRAPNIDDVGKVFDSQPGYVVVPNNELDSEYAYGGELGLTINLNNSVFFDFSSYLTYLDNAIKRDFFSINGVSQIFYDGEMCSTLALQNLSRARIYGFEFGLKAQLSNSLEINSQFSLINGRQNNNNDIEVPVRHVVPTFGNAHIVWNNDKLTFDAFVNFSGSLDTDEISNELSSHLFAQDNQDRPYAPSWYTLNIRTKYKFSDTISLVGSIENISNQGYRPFASGISAPGSNFIFSISYKN